MKKKMLICSIILAFVATASIACNKAEPNEKENVIQTPEAEKEVLDEEFYTADLSTERYDGYTYRILTRKDGSSTQYSEEPTGDIINDAIYKRNKLVENKFGIQIICNETSESNSDTTALNSILAGDDAYDLILTHSFSAFAYALQGASYNINDISTIHLNNPWWNKDLVDSCNINGKLYVLAGDYSINALQQSMCLFFNKRIFDELGFEYPYQMVKDGEWTFDEFAYLAKKGGKDINGDGIISPDADQYGFVAQEWYAPVNIIYAGGERVYSKNDAGMLELSFYSNKTVDIIEDFYSLLNNDACYLQYNDSTHRVSFKDGNAMFIDGSMNSATNYRSMDDDFGILPFPKYDEDDDYHTTYNAVADLGLIPITVSDVERTGAITEALCAYGSMHVLPAFYDTALKTKSSRDNDSEEMIDIIKNGLVYDVGYISGSSSLSGRGVIHDTHVNVASWYASREENELQKLADFNKNYAGIE